MICLTKLNRTEYNEKIRLAMQERRTRSAKKRVRCSACNKSFWSMSIRTKLCKDCKKLHKKIDMRVYRESKKITQHENINDSVKVSDFKFETDLCDMDCENCKHDDCILPEE